MYFSRAKRTYRKVLVIDDDSRLLASYQDLLVPYGFEVLTAENGKRACRVVEQHADITLVILDIMMPEMDGREWLRWLRDRQTDLPVIVITGVQFDPAEEPVRPTAVLEKPFHVAELLDLVGLFCGLSVMSSLRSV